jgi:hypothetical protein
VTRSSWENSEESTEMGNREGGQGWKENGEIELGMCYLEVPDMELFSCGSFSLKPGGESQTEHLDLHPSVSKHHVQLWSKCPLWIHTLSVKREELKITPWEVITIQG